MYFNGHKIFISEPYPVYKSVVLFKKHRKKKNRQPRVKVFSHWNEIIKDGEAIKIGNALHMTAATFDKLRKATEQSQRNSGWRNDAGW